MGDLTGPGNTQRALLRKRDWLFGTCDGLGGVEKQQRALDEFDDLLGG